MDETLHGHASFRSSSDIQTLTVCPGSPDQYSFHLLMLRKGHCELLVQSFWAPVRGDETSKEVVSRSRLDNCTRCFLMCLQAPLLILTAICSSRSSHSTGPLSGSSFVWFSGYADGNPLSERHLLSLWASCPLWPLLIQFILRSLSQFIIYNCSLLEFSSP